MKRLIFLLLAVLPLAAAEPTLSDQLRDALYTEEVERDPAKAAEAYQKILADFDTQRPLAASALFRLAEVSRKQEKNDEAIALYQRLLREFSDFEAESKFAREHLATLGGTAPGINEEARDAVSLDIRRYQEMAKNSPDVFRQTNTLRGAVSTGNIRIVEAVLELGADPFSYDESICALADAANAGHLEIVKLLIKAGGDPPATVAARTINESVRHPEILSYLIEQGFDVNGKVDTPNGFHFPLFSAIEWNQLDAAELLVKHGANINALATSYGNDRKLKTPLMIACYQRDLQKVAFLLKHEADPNIANPGNGRTALFEATTLTTRETPPIIAELLKHGANPNLTTLDPKLSPLLAAADIPVRDGNDNVRAVTELLLKHGADPNYRTPRIENSDMPQEYYNGVTALDLAIRRGDPAKVRLLVEAGAKPSIENLRKAISSKKTEINKLFGLLAEQTPDLGSENQTATLLEEVAKRGYDIAALIKRGAKPSANWIEQRFQGATDGNKRLLNESYIYPTLASQEKVWLIRTKWWNSDELLLPIADISQNPHLPSMARALLDSDITSKFNFFNNDGNPDNDEMETRWTLWRKNDKGELIANELKLAGDGELPDLEWGDILELETIGHAQGKDGFTAQSRLASSTTSYWNLLRRISFPIKVTRGEEISEITMRGDCLSYDPTKPSVPLLTAGYISQLLYPDEFYPSLSKPPEVIVHREGWDPIRLSYLTKEWKAFPLQANDRISVDAPVEDEAMKLLERKDQIRITVPGSHFSRYHKVEQLPVLLPMLSELITETYASWKFFESTKISDYSKGPLTRLGEIAHAIKEGPHAIPYLLPHPDLTGIRIRRLQEDASETIISPRLAESIATLTAESTREQLAEGDIQLQPGDIVELPLKESSEPWFGFDEQESRYFHRLLSGAFQLTDDKGTVSRKTINWQPAKLLPSPCGPIPFQPEIGTASTSAFALEVAYSYLQLRRNDENFDGVSPRGLFIRDGDQLSPRKQSPPKPRVRRVVPSSPSR